MANLDRTLGQFFAMLDRTGVDYVVALTADHGGNDIPERERERGDAERRPRRRRIAAAKHGAGDRRVARAEGAVALRRRQRRHLDRRRR